APEWDDREWREQKGCHRRVDELVEVRERAGIGRDILRMSLKDSPPGRPKDREVAQRAFRAQRVPEPEPKDDRRDPAEADDLPGLRMAPQPVPERPGNS